MKAKGRVCVCEREDKKQKEVIVHTRYKREKMTKNNKLHLYNDYRYDYYYYCD